jgi:peptidyl-dipeptidase Dcp
MSLLNKRFDTPYNTAPFSSIKSEYFLPAFIKAIEIAKIEIAKITDSKETPTFKNTIEALDYSGESLDRISSIFFNLNAAETNESIQKIAQEVSPLLTDFYNDIALNSPLFERIKLVYDTRKTLSLTDEQKILLDKKYKGFSRNGANLNNKDKETLRRIDKELGKLKLTFGENILAENNRFELLITDPSDLDGLPEGAIEAAKQTAAEKNRKGWVINLDYPSYIPFMTYSKKRTLRKELALAFGRKGFQNDALDNQEIVLRITQLRFKRAKLLGYNTHAHFVLEERMAKTPKNVCDFLENLLEKALPAAKKEFKELEAFAKKTEGINCLEKWDSAYYSEKLKQEHFNFNEEQLKPYFKLENVIEGAFKVAHKLFGLNFTETKQIDTYHNEVVTYKVVDLEQNLVAIFYTDFFPRKGKRNGAWMTSFKPQFVKDGIQQRPHVSIVCNFTKPTPTKPSLLTFNEVTTLFHEFGHALHGMLANTTYPSLSGTNVAWDFVELPSQIMENWCYEKGALALFAKHYETGDLIPMDLIDKIKSASTFQQGMQTLRQLSFGLLDMSWHGTDPSKITNIKKQEKEAFKQTQLFPDVKQNCMSTAFSHIFQGGYSSGYYSYKWAEVLDADAFEYFKQNSLFDPKIASDFKEHILSKGGTGDPLELYINFRGQKPKADALLRRSGLVS